MSKNCDWAWFGIPARTQRLIISHLAPLLNKGDGDINIAVRRHRVDKVKQSEIKEGKVKY